MPQRPIYSRQDLIRIGFQAKIEITGAIRTDPRHPTGDSKTAGHPMDCYRVQQALEVAQGEEVEMRMPGRTTKSSSSQTQDPLRTR